MMGFARQVYEEARRLHLWAAQLLGSLLCWPGTWRSAGVVVFWRSVWQPGYQSGGCRCHSLLLRFFLRSVGRGRLAASFRLAGLVVWYFAMNGSGATEPSGMDAGGALCLRFGRYCPDAIQAERSTATQP
jgi:hypothetical protein